MRVDFEVFGRVQGELEQLMHLVYLLKLDDLDVGASLPNLGCDLAVPPEGQDVTARLQRVRNLHHVLPSPGLISWVRIIYSGVVPSGPLGALRCGAFGISDCSLSDRGNNFISR